MILADGGTTVSRAQLADGSEVWLGLDRRIPKLRKEHVLFVGADYPTKPGARVLAKGSEEEAEVIAALQDYVARLPGREDSAAVDFLEALHDR
jgi:hypothetical protein